MSKSRVNKNWKRWLIILICLGLLTVHLIGPKIQFDATSIWLISIAAFFIIIPDPRIFIPYVKRIKLWEAEIELKEEIKELGKEVDKVSEAVESKSNVEITSNLSPEVEDILLESRKDPRAAFLLLSAKIESQIRSRLNEAGIRIQNYTLSKAVEEGVGAGLFPQEVLPAFRNFWSVRNKLAHSQAFDVEDSTILSLISIGTEILKILSTEPVIQNNNSMKSVLS